VEKAQALDDAVVEIDKLGLGQLVNVDLHNGTIDESWAGPSSECLASTSACQEPGAASKRCCAEGLCCMDRGGAGARKRPK
jgi:hypothetical protein